MNECYFCDMSEHRLTQRLKCRNFINEEAQTFKTTDQHQSNN